MRILVVEDDEPLREAVMAALAEDSYSVDFSGSGDEGLYLASQGIYDLVILDVMLPGLSGLEVVKRLRADAVTLPVLLLTAKDSVADKVKGLDAGADDYLVKPFAVPELLARVKALLRRVNPGGRDGDVSYGGISVNSKCKDGFVDGCALQLTSKEFELLEFLILNHDQILTREQIFDRIWGFDSETTIGIVDLYIHYLRKKLTPYQRDGLIRTVRGAGFMLKETK
ncbi:MAG TPA: response regulator transcription factor [Methylomusa anaerophila]|uniref:Response regulator ArlR n=1 Tax=Methylomusa anaerophila TaxID=1930071 RepID=A0A348AM96_9FIRM|nr:response regulator transcription factor [Methylomusa anaerophila]BBB92194.1 response regulator ArlR [Methylomusa anaerophila]HML87792.1 response regulator transcription factor [Methylomusa anaerophila]